MKTRAYDRKVLCFGKKREPFLVNTAGKKGENKAVIFLLCQELRKGPSRSQREKVFSISLWREEKDSEPSQD